MKLNSYGIFRLASFFLGISAAYAQQPIGTVGVQDATVAGTLEVTNGRAILVGNSTVTAKDHVAEITLNRGGSVRVCATSGLHVTAGKNATPAPLMLALDRGAIEVQMAATPNDVVMTPDLRFSMRNEGPLDLRIRVTKNGDTCVENRGAKAPTLGVADQFGEATYELRPDQHVLFEHGSLKEVVDHESSACGCPPEPIVSVADTGVTSSTPATPGSDIAAKSAAEQHPFPAAISAGLAPPAPVPQAPAGVVHAQVATTLSYDASGANETSQPVQPPAPQTTSENPSTGTVQSPPPPPAPPPSDLFHSIGHFFKRLFGGS